MADGVYSMYGDYAPVTDLISLSQKYPQLHLYFDDVHGMSWKGPNGSGYIMSMLEELPENILLFGTLSKTFGASGAVLVCPDKKLYRKIKILGASHLFRSTGTQCGSSSYSFGKHSSISRNIRSSRYVT